MQKWSKYQFFYNFYIVGPQRLYIYIKVAHSYMKNKKFEKCQVLPPKSVVLDSQKLRSKFKQNRLSLRERSKRLKFVWENLAKCMQKFQVFEFCR